MKIEAVGPFCGPFYATVPVVAGRTVGMPVNGHTLPGDREPGGG